MAFGNNRLGRLYVQLDATTQPLQDKIRRMEQEVIKAGDKLGKGFGQKLAIGLRLSGAAATAASIAFAAYSKVTIDWADNLRIASDRLGVTTSQLQLLRNAAVLSNSSIGALETGFQRFSRRLGEAQLGRGEALPAFNALGVDYKGRSSFDVFKDTINSLDKLASQEERLAHLSKLVDTEGVAAFDQFIRGGAGSLDKLQQELERTGQIIDEKTVKSLSEASQAIGRMTTYGINQFRSLTATILETSGALDAIKAIAPPNPGSARAQSPGFSTVGQGIITTTQLAALKASGTNLPPYLMNYLKTGQTGLPSSSGSSGSVSTATMKAAASAIISPTIGGAGFAAAPALRRNNSDMPYVNAVEKNTSAINRLANLFGGYELPESVTGRLMRERVSVDAFTLTPQGQAVATRTSGGVIQNFIGNNFESPEQAGRKYTAQAALVPRGA